MGISFPIDTYGNQVENDTIRILMGIVPENSWLSAELKLIEAKKIIDYYPEKALKLSLEAEKTGQKYNDLKLIGIAKRFIGVCYYNLNQINNSRLSLQNSVNLLSSINEKREANLSKLELGYVIGTSVNYQTGIIMIESTIDYFTEENDNFNLGKIYMYIGDIQKKERIYNYSVESYLKSISYFDIINQDSDKYYAMNEIASVFKNMKQYKIALKLYNQILDYTMSKNNKNGQGAVLNNIADLYKVLKEYNLALDYFKKAAILTKETGLKYNLAVVYNNLGKTEFIIGNNQNAINYYDEALQLIDLENDYYLAANLYLNYIEIYLLQKNASQCNLYSEKTKNHLPKINDNKIIARYYDLLSKTNALENNFKDALQNRMIYEKINDSINTENSYEQISDIRIEYETKLKKKENELLSAENTNLKKSKIILIVAILLTIIIIIFVFIYFILKIKNNKQKQLIFRQNNELIKKELLLVKDNHEIGQKELVANVLRDNISKEMINEIIAELTELSLKTNEALRKSLNNIIKKLDKSTPDDNWEKFELHFSKVNERFYSNLLKKHPDLTPGEKRLCALLLINLTSKEIAAITSQTFRSVTTARYRLRLKLNLQHEENIITYLETLK